MEENEKDLIEINSIREFVMASRIDDAVKLIALYLGDSTEENYIDRLENIIELLLSLHGGRVVLRFLIENLVIDISSLLENLSKKDSVLRYTFLLLLKTICENECDLFLPYSEDLLNSDDPNVREADLQLLIYMAGGDNIINDESLIRSITLKLTDEKDFVVEKAIQTLKTIGEKSPSIVTKVLTDFVKENSQVPENEELRNSVDSIIKSFVTIEKIEEIVEATEEKKDGDLEKEVSEITEKELELKKKDLELKKKKLELAKKEKILEEKSIKEKGKVLKLKEELLFEETKLSEEEILADKDPMKKIPKKRKKEVSEIIGKEIELKKKGLEIEKKKLELKEEEKKLEEKSIQEKEKVLKLKEELLVEETKLSGKEILVDIVPMKKVPKELKKEVSEIKAKEKELQKKDLEIKKKKLELEEKEKELEEREIIEKEKTLKIKEEFIEKEKALSQVELELKKKAIKQKEQKILEEEAERVDNQLKKLSEKEKNDENS